jgi:hypothetical protein
VKAGVRQTFNGLHGVISQKVKLFITTAVRSSDPTIMIMYIVINGKSNSKNMKTRMVV